MLFMKTLGIFLILISFLLSACGGGGGSSTPPVVPKVSISGPSIVWSDDYDWSASATATGMDRSTVGFTMSGGDEYIEIDSVTGAINSAGGNLDIGSHRFTISATDASGASASTTYDLRSDAFIAGVWLTNDTGYGEYFRLDVTRSGEIFTASWTDYNDDFEECSGKFAIIGSGLDGKINCNSYLEGVDSNFAADVEGIMDGGDITLNKMTITSGEFAGQVVDEPTVFYRSYNTAINIAPGIYIHLTDLHGYIELQVSTGGSFSSLPQEEAVINYSDISSCHVSGNISADPIYGLTTASDNQYPSVDVHDSTFTASSCSTDYDQSMAASVAFAGLSPVDNSTPFLWFGTPGNRDSNNGFNASSVNFIQVCDGFNQPTDFADYYGLNCSVSQSGRYSGKLRKSRVNLDSWSRGPNN
tara:strand:+ start:433 stop:1677 length:1245 start_codon:yes stop_codon:yes gene_type:complete